MKMDGGGSGSCLMATFDIRVETSYTTGGFHGVF